MFQLKSIKHEPLLFIEPDYIEQRNEEYLMVWKNLPHWMVVDKEFYAFLKECNGQNSVNWILAQHREWKKYSRTITPILKELTNLSILTSSAHPNKPGAAKDEEYRIENIALNLTKDCNLRCTHCYNADYLNKLSNELSGEEIISFLKEAQPYLSREPSLTILGGEPLKQIGKLLEVAQFTTANGFTTLVSTNGTLVTEEFAAEARKIGLQVQVSIDGHNTELNDPVRGNGSFNKLTKGIDILVKNRVYTILSLVCHLHNIDYLQDFYELALALNVNEARFIPLKKMGAAASNKLKPASTKRMITCALELFEKHPEFKKLAGRDTFSIIASTCKLSNRRPSCGTGLQTVLLDADGTLYPCLNTNIPALRIANIRDRDFMFDRIWTTSPVLESVRHATSVNNLNESCSKCVVKYWCLGGCRGETLCNTGDLNNRAINCADLRKSLLEMFWILSKKPDIVRSIKNIC